MTTISLVEIFSKDGCHLCDRAVETAMLLQRSHRFDLKVTKLAEGDRQFEEFQERFPVITVSGAHVADFRIREDELLKALSATAA